MPPESTARIDIDAKLAQAGWIVQDYAHLNLAAGRGIAVREFPLKTGHGAADYLLYVDRKAIGVVEAKKVGTTLKGVETQSEKYSLGLPEKLPAHYRPLPFLYESTGVETQFTNLLDHEPTSREVFTFHRPESLADFLTQSQPLSGDLVAETKGQYLPTTLLSRLNSLPPLNPEGMRDCQIQAITNLEKSLASNRRRSLLQMQTGSGKTYTAVAESYRLIRFAGAKRIVFIVDRGNLGRQTLAEFQKYVAPDDGRKFTELYNVQLLKSNKIDPVAKVVITTIQRLYSILKGEPEFDESLDEESPLTGHCRPAKRTPPGRLQPQHPHRNLRLRLHRRMPPKHLQPMATSARILRRKPHRPNRYP